jgi:hypothetical protein
MNLRATAGFTIDNWDEKPYDEREGELKLTRASVTESFQGDIVGEGTVEYLMVHRDDDWASFVRIERVVGRMGDRSGSFVLQGSGTYERGTAKGTLFVVPGTGTGDFQGLRGEGAFVATHHPPGSITLNYDFE